MDGQSGRSKCTIIQIGHHYCLYYGHRAKQTVLQTATLRETPSGIFDDRPNSDVHFHYFRGLVEIDESKSDYNFKLNDESTTSPDNKPIYIL